MTDKKEKKPSSSQIVSAALSGLGIQGMSSEKAKAIILLIGFIIVIAFFVFPYLIGIGSEFFSGSMDGVVIFIGIIMAASIIYLGVF
jgi:uncharacterized membrane protein (DUF485 family)